MIRDLTIEYRKNPIGIDEKPRFSWKLESEKQDVVQTSYQIQVVRGGQLDVYKRQLLYFISLDFTSFCSRQEY